MRFTNRQILKITFPVLLSLMMEQLIGLTDTIYLGHVGEVELGASAIAGIFYLTIFMVGFGFSIGAQVLIARRNGEGNLAGIGPIFMQGMWFLLGMAVLFFGVSLLFALLPRVVLGAYTSNAELIAAAVPSLWVMLTTIVPCVPAFIYQFSVSGTGNTRTALGITLVCVTAYTLYTLWLVYVLRADVALCWTADHVYYLISLALSYAYIRSGRWRRLKI